MLSKVERGEKSPTIGIATRIAHALDTSLSSLVGGDATGHGVAVMRRHERPVFRDPETGFERHIVSPAGRAGRVEVLYHYLPPGTSTGNLPPYPPGTEKQVVVTEGDLIVVTGRPEQRLASGDALVFEASLEHAFENRSSEPCGYYLIVSRQP
jgi:uncharacterized cupin superfamily protein